MDVLEAYERSRTAGVVVPRPDRGLVRLTGPQRMWFLHNTITADIEGTEPGRWVESCFLERKGKVMAHFRAGVLADEIYLDVDPPATGELVDWMIRYRFRTQVDIEDASTGSCTVIGPPAGEIAAVGEVRRMNEAVVFGWSLSGRAVADVHAPAPRDVVANLPEAPAELYDVLRLEAGIGEYGVDYDVRTLPQEAALTSVVSVTKGCYIGQEVMARLHFRGHVNRVLRTITFPSDADPERIRGKDVSLDGERLGTLTSSARSPEQGTIGLGLIRVEPPEGATVEVAGALGTLGPLPAATKVKG